MSPSDQIQSGWVKGDIMSTIFAKGGFTFGTLFDDVIEGSEEIDQIIASFGNDVITGAGGDDTLDGGAGNDVLLGGPGADTFLFKPFSASGQDTIGDFNVFDDRLVLDLPGDFSRAAISSSVLDFTAVGNDMLITLDNTDLHLTLQNFDGPWEAPISVSFV
jgi:Ca2+-binding RTX toxin-like protein